MRSLALAFLFLAIAPSAFAGGPLELTGVWEGSYSCKTEGTNGKDKLDIPESTLLITQLGPSGPLVANIIAKGVGAFSGTIAESDVKPNEGTGAWIFCGTSDATTTSLYNEITTFHYKVGADGSGTIKSTGTFVINSVQTGVCKGSWTRTSLGPVKTSPCP